MAVVEELVKGKDGETRDARVRVISKGKAHRLSRPVQKLLPLEVKQKNGVMNREQKEKVTRQTWEREKRPTRAAALDTDWKTRGMID